MEKEQYVWRYISEVRSAVGNFGIDVPVFDSYAVSTKDCTHVKRTRKKLNIVDIRDDNLYPGERELFLLTAITQRNSFQSWLGSYRAKVSKL